MRAADLDPPEPLGIGRHRPETRVGVPFPRRCALHSLEPGWSGWQLSHGVYRPDLSLILTGDPTVINARLRARGGHSCFERAADNSDRESALYTRAVADLQDKGWPVQTVDCITDNPDLIAARIVSLIHHTLGEKSPVCL